MSKEEAIELYRDLLRYGEEGLSIDEYIAKRISKALALLESEPEPTEFTKNLRKQLNAHTWSLPSREQGLQACNEIDRLNEEMKSWRRVAEKLEHEKHFERAKKMIDNWPRWKKEVGIKIKPPKESEQALKGEQKSETS